MRFKTTIKILTEAQNRNEAVEIVDEYLSGNLMSGVDMRCSTKPVTSKAKIAGVLMVSIAIIAGVFFTTQVREPQNLFRNTSGVSAMQPPLNTSPTDKKSADFKEKWETRQLSEALDYIKNK